MAAYSVVPAVFEGARETRAAFYARRRGGGYRTARKGFTCQQALCLSKIVPKERFFDTLEPTTWPLTKRICAHCAEETPP